MSVADADALVWWEWRLLLEGLEEEARVMSGEEPEREVRSEPERFTRAGFTTRTVRRSS